MGAVSTLAADKLKIKGAIRSALAALAAVIDSNTSGISSNTSNLSAKDNVATLSDNTTLTAAQNGGVFLVDTDAKTITLPATAEGLKYTFVNAGADGDVALTVSPAAGDAIIGSIPNSAGDSVSGGADGKDLVNTKTTANKGDSVTIVGDGVAGWYIVGGVGIWASES